MKNLEEEGSLWRKWDLHVHTIYSDGKATSEEIISKAKDNDISVIAITDHHTAKGIDEAKDIGYKKGVTVIGGIEFRTEYGSSSVHIIGLFPDNYNGIRLDQKKLHDLILSPLGLSESHIITKGKESNPSIEDEVAFKQGIFKVQVDFKKASELIHKYGGIVSVHAGSKSNSIDEEMKHEGKSPKNVSIYDSLGPVKDELFKGNYIDICEIRNEKDGRLFYANTFNKPSIQTSDAHKLEDFGERYTWIKADPTFEGLKQIIYEPIDRVSFSLNKPEFKSSYQIIKDITINNCGKISNDKLILNPNLCSIIGGRSTGKSILLAAIATKLKNVRDIEKGKDSYYEFIKDISSKMTIKWSDNEINDLREVEFFHQGYMNNLANNKTELNNLIQDIIKEKGKDIDINNFKLWKSKNKSEIQQLINRLFEIQRILKDKESQKRDSGDEKGIVTEIKRLEEELKSKSFTKISEEEKQSFENLQKEIVKNDLIIKKLIIDLEKMESSKTALIFSESINDIIRSFITEDAKQLSEEFYELKISFEGKWTDIVNKYLKNIKIRINQLKESNNQIKETDSYKKVTTFYEGNKHLSEYNERIKNEQAKLNKINALDAEIKRIKEEFKKIIGEIKEKHYMLYAKINELSPILSQTTDILTIEATVNFDEKKYTDLLNNSISQRSAENQERCRFTWSNFEDYKSHIFSIFDLIIHNNISLKGAYTNQKLASELFSESYFYINYNIVYQGDNFEEMSDGKKSFVVLNLLLEFSDKKCPILIDQPEDDLDNRAIYNELVTYLKNKKKERQIILVTHNSNIVVGADSEQIIIANQHGLNAKNEFDKKFQYLTGSLEHTQKKTDNDIILYSKGIREHVCEILEGGKLAFEKREAKYGFKFN